MVLDIPMFITAWTIFSLLSLFTFFMFFLVTSSNFIQLFFGWEGVGLCSYLLINFWYKRILANKAAIKAMLMNRIADVFFILGILCAIAFLSRQIMDALATPSPTQAPRE